MALTKSICDFAWKAPDFALKGIDGKTYTLADVRGPKGTLVDAGRECPTRPFRDDEAGGRDRPRSGRADALNGMFDKVEGVSEPRRSRKTNELLRLRRLSFPKITSVRIRAVRQNQRMIQRDARGPDSDWSACRQPVQVAAPA